jgi:hypothetical protein
MWSSDATSWPKRVRQRFNNSRSTGLQHRVANAEYEWPLNILCYWCS